jgi:hypothetical protein
MQACAVGYALTYLSTPKPLLVTSTIVGLTAAKFELLMFPLQCSSLSHYKYVSMLIILNDFYVFLYD